MIVSMGTLWTHVFKEAHAVISRDEWPDIPLSETDYYALIRSTGIDVVDSEDEDDYQGDSFALVRDGERWGWVTFGWGSCSGCDALQAAEGDADELSKLRSELVDSIVWRDSIAAVIEYVNDPDVIRHWIGNPAARALVDRISSH